MVVLKYHMALSEPDTRVYDEAYFWYVEKVNPRRTPLIKTREKGPFPDGN